MKRILVLICGLAISSSILAQADSRVYVGGSLGYTDTHWDPTYDSTGFGFNLLGGYKFNSLWSFEGSFTHFAAATAPKSSDISTNAVAGLAKITLPLGSSKFNFLSKVGLGYTFTSGAVSRNHFGPVFGVGVGLPINDQMNVEGSFTHFAGSSGSNGIPNADFYGFTFNYFLPKSLVG